MSDPGQQTTSDASKKALSGWSSAFTGAIAGSLGTTIVGLIFSTATLTFLSNLFGHNILPSDAVIFVAGSDCGSAGDGWKKLEQAQGRFIVAAGLNTDFQRIFQANVTGTGTINVKLNETNLPPLNITIPYVVSNFDAQNGGYPTMRDLAPQGGDAVRRFSVVTGGQSAPFETLPPWIGLTACHKS